MNLIRWEPFKDAEALFRGLSPTFLPRFPRVLGENGNKLEWAPAADISEDENEYLVTAELPGVRRDDMKVTLENGTLTIHGERRDEKDAKSGKTHRTERFYGTFYRSFTLPEGIDAAGVRAESKDGVLNVHVPKARVEKTSAVQIKVQ